MKRFFNVFLNILKYVLVYLGTTIVTSLVFVLFFFIKNSNMFFTDSQFDIQLFSLEFTKVIPYCLFTITIISLFIFLFMIKVKHKSIKSFLRFNKAKKSIYLSSIFIAIGFSLIAFSIVSIGALLSPSAIDDYIKSTSDVTYSISSVLGIISLVIIIPIFEEIFFRGIIFNDIMNNTKKLSTAIILQALIFAFFHGNLLQGIYTFFLGIALAMQIIYSNSIIPSIITHLSFNLLGTLVMPILLSDNPSLIPVYLSVGILITFISTYFIYMNKVPSSSNNKLTEVILK